MTKYEQRRKAIIRAAVGVINRKGVKGMTFSDVAARLDLVTSAISYYFRRKEDLAAACLLESIACFERFADAADAGETPTERVRLYLLSLMRFWSELATGQAEPVVLFNEVRTIGDPMVDAAYLQMYRRLRRQLDISPRLRPLERNARTHQFITQAIWMTLWADRYDPRDFERIAQRTADILICGLAAPDHHWSSDTLPADRSATPPDAFLTAATELINEEGYRGASVDRIAARLNLTKGAFYHRHDAKDDLVVAGFHRTLALIRQAQDRAEAAGTSSLECLCLAVDDLFRGHLDRSAPLLRISALAAVPEDIGQDIFLQFSRVSLHFAGLVADGMRDGSIRAVDPNIAGFMITAMISGATELTNWVPGVTAPNAASAFFRPLVEGMFSNSP